MQPQVFDLLLFLIKQRDRVVSKDDLIGGVWGNRIISDSALNSRVNAARKAVQDDGKAQRLIRTIARKGFRFVGDCVQLSGGGQGVPAEPDRPPASVVSDRPAIAVLAFKNMSDDAEQEYFCDGISEDILTASPRCGGSLSSPATHPSAIKAGTFTSAGSRKNSGFVTWSKAACER